MPSIAWHRMEARNGIYIGKPNMRRKKLDLFRPISVKSDGRRIQSRNWSVRFQHQGKRTCRSLGTPDYRLAQQRAKALIASVRQGGWAKAAALPTSHGTLPIADFIQRYHRSAVARGLRPRSINNAEIAFRRLAREIGARRLGDLSQSLLQSWVESCGLTPVTLRSVLKNAACPFSKASLQSLGLSDLPNPFANTSEVQFPVASPYNTPT